MKFPIHLLLLLLGFLSCKTDSQSPKDLYSYDIESRLDSLGIQLPPVKSPVANYVHVVQSGNLLFLAGKGPKDESGANIMGRLGEDMDVAAGYHAAHRIAVAQLAVLKDHLGDLNKVKRIVKVKGMVRCTDDFTQQSQVINGFSDTMVKVFGHKGKHARAAVGMNALPGGICAEIEMVVEI